MNWKLTVAQVVLRSTPVGERSPFQRDPSPTEQKPAS